MNARSGTSMQIDRRPVRYVSRGAGQPPKEIDVVAARKLLRTDLTIQEIAVVLGVESHTLRNFIRRRNICDLRERRIAIGRAKMAASP